MTAVDETRAQEIVARYAPLSTNRMALEVAIATAISEARDQGAHPIPHTSLSHGGPDHRSGRYWITLEFSTWADWHAARGALLDTRVAPAIAPLREEVVRLALKAATLRGQSKAEHRRACVARDKACAALAATQEPTP